MPVSKDDGLPLVPALTHMYVAALEIYQQLHSYKCQNLL